MPRPLFAGAKMRSEDETPSAVADIIEGLRIYLWACLASFPGHTYITNGSLRTRVRIQSPFHHNPCLVSRARLSYTGRESGQIPIRLWCCILSSRAPKEVGVNMNGCVLKRQDFR